MDSWPEYFICDVLFKILFYFLFILIYILIFFNFIYIYIYAEIFSFTMCGIFYILKYINIENSYFI